MRFIYLNMDSSTLHGTEEDLILSTEDTGVLPQMEAITNIIETETLIAAGHIPFTRAEAQAVHRGLQMGVSHAGKRH